jgi:hypothetical protein
VEFVPTSPSCPAWDAGLTWKASGGTALIVRWLAESGVGFRTLLKGFDPRALNGKYFWERSQITTRPE